MDKAQPEDKILSPEEIELVKKTVRQYMTRKMYDGYFIIGYMILLAIETGMRVAELCSLKWVDIRSAYIHIHTQQLFDFDSDKKKRYFLAEWTKEEKGYSHGGRRFPLTDNIRGLLEEIQDKQNGLGIKSEFVFCDRDNNWITTNAYMTCLNRLCKHIGLDITNNHAFRMSLNSNVLIPMGIPVTERASILGHSPQTNLQFYSYAEKDSISQICDKLNIYNKVTP